jgi:hypothetical protein
MHAKRPRLHIYNFANCILPWIVKLLYKIDSEVISQLWQFQCDFQIFYQCPISSTYLPASWNITLIYFSIIDSKNWNSRIVIRAWSGSFFYVYFFFCIVSKIETIETIQNSVWNAISRTRLFLCFTSRTVFY